MHRRLIGSVSTRIIDKEIDTIQINWNNFFHNVLFSDHYILDSIRLREIPMLVKQFGYWQVRDLLKSEAISLRCEAYNTGIFNLNSSNLFQYNLLGFDSDNTEDYLQGCLGETGFQNDLNDYMPPAEKIELMDLVHEKLLGPPSAPLIPILRTLKEEITNNQATLKYLIKKQLLVTTGRTVPFEHLKISTKFESENYFVNNNLECLGIHPKIAHQILGKCLLALSRQHLCLHKMEIDNAIACYREDEQPFLLKSIKYFEQQINPNTQTEAFQRIVRLAELPQLNCIEKLNISKLLEVRNSPEMLTFKKWMSKAQDYSDDEITNELNHQISKILSKISLPVGEAIGHIVNFSSAAFLSPLQGLAATYFPWLIDKFLSKKGHVLFLYRDYKSIYDGTSF